jgi:hypothetical protein
MRSLTYVGGGELNRFDGFVLCCTVYLFPPRTLVRKVEQPVQLDLLVCLIVK